MFCCERVEAAIVLEESDECRFRAGMLAFPSVSDRVTSGRGAPGVENGGFGHSDDQSALRERLNEVGDGLGVAP